MKRSRKNRRSQKGGQVTDLVFISGNAGKISELTEILKPINVTNIDIDLPEIQTTEVEEVVREKVLSAWNETHKPLFVEDTGLYITSEPMNGFPGALIKFYFKKLGLDGICEKNGGNDAYAESVIGYHDGTSVQMFKGTVNGKIAERPQPGPYGFGWDAVFIPTEHEPSNTLSFAELTPEIKNNISMRNRAGQEFKRFLEKNE